MLAVTSVSTLALFHWANGLNERAGVRGEGVLPYVSYKQIRVCAAPKGMVSSRFGVK